MATVPVVYTLVECPACIALREAWAERGIQFEERGVEESQQWMDEARGYSDMVPIIVYPDGRVESGAFEGKFG